MHPISGSKIDVNGEWICIYTHEHPELKKAHHFDYDVQNSPFNGRADFFVMGINPGETREESAEKDRNVDNWTPKFNRGRLRTDATNSVRWGDLITDITCSKKVVLAELFFWSSKNIYELNSNFGRFSSERMGRHLDFCAARNNDLIAFYSPKAVIGVGLGMRFRASRLYKLTPSQSIPDGQGGRLLEFYRGRHGVPWVFTKHWTGSFGFSSEQKNQIRDQIRLLA